MKRTTVGQFLKNKRLQKGYTLSHAKTISDLSYSTLVNWENDAVLDIRLDRLSNLLSVYDTDITELVSKTKGRVDGPMLIQEICR